MEKITGKTIIFTDLHCGLSGNKVSRLNICIMVIKELLIAIKTKNIENIIFLGDWYHNRNTLDLNTINISLKLIQALAKKCKCYLIVGNHDAYLKNSTDINSLNMFRDTPNVKVFDKAVEVELNHQKCLFVPWLTDTSVYKNETFDIAFGHFEISSKYLIQSYIEEHADKIKISNKLSENIDNDNMLKNQNNSNAASSLIGNFVDLVKKNGYVYAGHIHAHKEFIAKGRNFIFVGAPYEHNLGDINNDKGYYILDANNKPEFIKITSVPKHVQIKISDAISGGYDFSCIKNNIIQKIYDIDITSKQESLIDQRINDNKPYEELIPDYRVKLDFEKYDNQDNSSIDLIRKGKLDYIKNYIDNIDPNVLSSQNIDKDKLFNILNNYYKLASEK